MATFQVDHIPSLPEAADEVAAEVDRLLSGIPDDLQHGVQHKRNARAALTVLLANERARSMAQMLQDRLLGVPPDIVALMVPEDLAQKIVEEVAGLNP